MFTGLVVELGRLSEPPAASPRGGVRLVVALSGVLLERLPLGASLAVDGVCLTVTERLSEPPRVAVELSPETLERTRLGELRQGDGVNLEPALRAGDALGGHWVQGHVDGLVEVLERRDRDDHRELAFSLAEEWEPYLVEKGSVTLDGVSLTVSARAPGRFEVALIPHTLEVSQLDRLTPGDRVHLEVDVLAKYVGQAIRGHLEHLERRVEASVTDIVERLLAERLDVASEGG